MPLTTGEREIIPFKSTVRTVSAFFRVKRWSSSNIDRLGRLPSCTSPLRKNRVQAAAVAPDNPLGASEPSVASEVVDCLRPKAPRLCKRCSPDPWPRRCRRLPAAVRLPSEGDKSGGRPGESFFRSAWLRKYRSVGIAGDRFAHRPSRKARAESSAASPATCTRAADIAPDRKTVRPCRPGTGPSRPIASRTTSRHCSRRMWLAGTQPHRACSSGSINCAPPPDA